MRVGVVDIGSNSTRLLVADVHEGAITDVLERRSEVTRLGQDVDRTGRLADAAMNRVRATLDGYRRTLDDLGVARAVAVLTSATRDASNGAAFLDDVRERYRLDAHILPGEDEARLGFLGATSERDPSATTPTAMIDIGGGSTELVVGRGRTVDFHVSTQAGVVRHSERYLHSDPPKPDELAALAEDVRAIFAAAVPAGLEVEEGIAVAGTPTHLAGVDGAREPDGHVLSATRIAELRDMLAALPLAERRRVPGLDPARAPTIVAGAVLLSEALARFTLDEVQVSERDILHGVALDAAASST